MSAPSPAECTIWVGARPRAERRGGLCCSVKRGDTLASISKAVHGHGSYWRRIRDANPGRGTVATRLFTELPAVEPWRLEDV